MTKNRTQTVPADLPRYHGPQQKKLTSPEHAPGKPGGMKSWDIRDSPCRSGTQGGSVRRRGCGHMKLEVLRSPGD